MRRLLSSLIVTGVVVTSVIGLTRAFFSDTETSTNNTLTAGELDLKIDNTSYYNGLLNPGTTWAESDLPGHYFFDFNDVKPGDRGEDTISLHVQNNAWACMNINLTNNDDNTCTEPELLDDPTCTAPGLNQGELAQNINFAFWADDGDNVYETDETIFKSGSAATIFNGQTWTLTDSGFSVWPTPGPIPGNEIRYIGKYWCLGTLTPAPVAPGANNPTQVSGFNCDGAILNNATQTDIAKADVNFTAIQARNNPSFECAPRVTPTITPTPTPLSCVIQNASDVVTSSQGTRKNGTAILATRTNPLTALVPQTTGLAFDPAPADNTFFSLGFKINQPANGTLTVKFANPVFNGPGNDLRVYEVTGGPPYPDEKVLVEVSPDNITYTSLGNITKDGFLDFGALPSIQYVRLTDTSNIALFEDTADAYDVDGVQALCAVNNQ